jgi:hypothetical protein
MDPKNPVGFTSTFGSIIYDFVDLILFSLFIFDVFELAYG